MLDTPEAGQNIITRGLPKTGQVVEYQAGDDGTYEAGWWKGRLNANNRTRFITRTIGGDDVILDRATGLMWAADGNTAGCNNSATIAWGAAINYANALNFAGFTDWRLPNVFEAESIMDYTVNRYYSPPFVNFAVESFWTSTTTSQDAFKAWKISSGYILVDVKTALFLICCVRKGI